MITKQKIILIIIATWCILEILTARRKTKPLVVLLCVSKCHDLLEPIVRCLRFEFEFAFPGQAFQLSLGARVSEAAAGPDGLNRVVNFLCAEGLLTCGLLREPDLVLYIGAPASQKKS